MKKLCVVLLGTGILFSCAKEPVVDANYVIEKYNENINKVNAIEYRMQRIDSFAKSGEVWNNTGVALLEKNKDDKVFGFSFYGKRDDINKEYLYDDGKGFEILLDSKSYYMEPEDYGIIGSPGGQMAHYNVYNMFSTYKSVQLEEIDESFRLIYGFEDDTVYNRTDRMRIVQINKKTFLPEEIYGSSKQLGYKTTSISRFSDIKINENVSRSIASIKEELQNYKFLASEVEASNALLSKELPESELADLLDETKKVKLPLDQLTLIDFWEVWCGPCIASFPKVEALKNKYAGKLQVIGIVSEDKENAIKLLTKKGVTFTNLVGSKDLEKTFGITRWPTYFLVDKSGVVQKVYFGFSEDMEKDIQSYLSK